jgi:hypothetical protein
MPPMIMAAVSRGNQYTAGELTHVPVHFTLHSADKIEQLGEARGLGSQRMGTGDMSRATANVACPLGCVENDHLRASLRDRQSSEILSISH